MDIPMPQAADAASSPIHAALTMVARMVTAMELSQVVAVHSVDRDGVVCFCNQAWADLLGRPMVDILGQPLTALVSYGGRQAEYDALMAQVWRSARASAASDWQVRLPDGRELWLYATRLPIATDGALSQIYCMDVDVTQRHAQLAAAKSDGARFNHVFARSGDAILLLQDGKIIEANPAALALFRCDGVGSMAQRALGEFAAARQPGGASAADAVRLLFAQAARQGNARGEWYARGSDGKQFWVEVLLTALDQEQYYLVARDISARKQGEHMLRLTAQVFENSRDAIVLTDRRRNIIAVNHAYADSVGAQGHDLVGQPFSLYRTGVQDDAFAREVWAQIDAGDHWEGETLARRSDGSLFPCWLSISAIRDSTGRVGNYLGVLTDITARKQSEEQTRHLAEHDFLTDLPNRVLLLDRLSQALANARRGHGMLALLFLDLDRFKQVNDNLGHAMGDRLLQEVARRLVRCVREADTVSRQGGDEFVILLADLAQPGGAAHVAESVLQSLAQDVQLDGHALQVSASIGIAVFPADGEDGDTLLRHADMAMYHAKQRGRGGYQFFSRAMNARIVQRSELEAGLRRALSERQFELAYEPELDIASGRLIAMEALLRWRHPQRGLLLPQRFLGVAQEAGLMVDIGDWVLQAACQRARGWHDAGHALSVAVNLAPSQLTHPRLPERVAAALAGAGLGPAFLELEVTEASIMQGGTAGEHALQRLRGLGVRLSIDDFGTGYSRLAQLKDSPVEKLKIAQTFFEREADATAIRTIVAMAHSLEMTVIAEGVRNEAQLDLLRDLGCDQYQGRLAGARAGPLP